MVSYLDSAPCGRTLQLYTKYRCVTAKENTPQQHRQTLIMVTHVGVCSVAVVCHAYRPSRRFSGLVGLLLGVVVCGPATVVVWLGRSLRSLDLVLISLLARRCLGVPSVFVRLARIWPAASIW